MENIPTRALDLPDSSAKFIDDIEKQKHAKVNSDIEAEGRYLALLIAFNSIKEKYTSLQKSLRVSRRDNMTSPLNQLDSPTEADQLQMLLEMKTKECESLASKLEQRSSREKQYMSDLEVAQENLKYAIDENDKLQKELEHLKGKDYVNEQSCTPTMSFGDPSQVYDSTVLCRGLIDRSFCTEQPHKSFEGNYDLNRQVQILTLEKKQLMTHVHWLTNELRNKDSRLTDISQIVAGYNSNLSCEELAKALKGTLQLSNEASSLEEGIQRSISGAVSVNRHVTDAVTQTPVATNDETMKAFKERIRLLHSNMITLKSALQDGIKMSDSIQKSAVQSVRHPFEPRLYSDFASGDASSVTRSPSEGALSMKAVPAFSLPRSSMLLKGKHRGQAFRQGSKSGDDLDEEYLCGSVYHSAAASPQDGMVDDTDLYALRTCKLTVGKRGPLDIHGKEDSSMGFRDRRGRRSSFTKEDIMAANVAKENQFKQQQARVSEELPTANLVGPELQTYLARKLLGEDRQADSCLMFDWARQNSSDRTPAMSLGPSANYRDNSYLNILSKPKDESI